MKKTALLSGTGVLAVLFIIFTLNCDDNGGAPAAACVDNDGDTYGEHCSAGPDCNDSDASVNPGAAEVNCDGINNDCGTATPDAPDGDGDGWDICGASDPVNPDGKLPADCNDGDNSVYPGAAETYYNGVDDDCNPVDTIDNDQDGDGYTASAAVGSSPDCDDTVASINPGADDVCGDGIDQNCNGSLLCYAYLADYGSGLAVIDVTDPTSPGTPVYRDTNGSSWEVYVTGGYAYVADSAQGLAVIDVTDPTSPGTPVYRDTSGTSFGVYVTGGYAYVADGNSGLAIINVSDPTAPGTPV
ncbi:MAG: hypothetical protein JSU92_04425, partial [Deltaproteobacteria bacterium]